MNPKFVNGQKPFPDSVTKSIFLLGPIPRTADTQCLSWKSEAYQLLKELGYDGVVYDPEHIETPDVIAIDYDRDAQINWEVEALNRADVIVAWIPRTFPNMPAMTSNIEMGEWFKSGKMILGYPARTPRMDYIDYRATDWLQETYKWQVPVYHTLKETLQAALDRIGSGALRRGVETKIPLDIWKEKTFQHWYGGLELAGHELDDFQVEYMFCRRQDEVGRPKQKVWAIRPKVHIADEHRYKNNEVIIGRPATVSVIMYYPNTNNIYMNNINRWEVVLVSEYRPAVMNYKGMVYEFPGGSIEPLEGPFDEKAILGSALKEVEEEVGIRLDASKLLELGVRQGMATMVACEHHVFAYHLDIAEYELIKELCSAEVKPVDDNEERTVPKLVIVDSLYDDLGGVPLDWINMGMLMSFVGKGYRAFI